MSKFRRFETVFKDEGLLIQALQDVCQELGGEPVLSHANDLVLYGFHGDARPERAKFAIRRNLIGRVANDLGFEQAQDGAFDVIISDFDKASDTPGHGLHVLNKVKTRYNYHKTAQLAWEKGYTLFESYNDQGEQVLTLQRAY